MQSNTKSPAEIEHEIERERAELKGTLGDLQDRFSVDGITRQVTDQVRLHGADMGRSVARSVRDNPMAVALTGIGLAWMILGNRGTDSRDSHRTTGEVEDARVTRLAPRPPQPAATVPRTTPTTGRPAHPATAGAATQFPDWAREPDDIRDTASSGDGAAATSTSMRDTGERARRATREAGAKAAERASDMRDKAAEGAPDIGQRVSDMGEQARGAVASRAEMARRRAEAIRARVSRGTENLGEEARARVIAARERAIEARDQATRSMRQGADQAADFYDRHPLVVGALALAAGAALAGALPRTRAEDENLGAYRDDLFDEAERIFEEERAKAERVVQTGVEEAKKAAKETKQDLDDRAPEGKSAQKDVADKAKAATAQVAQATRDKAKKEKLGKPNS